MANYQKIIKGSAIALLILLSISWFWYRQSVQEYQKLLTFKSPIGDSLAIFAYNQSQHRDPVPHCWYDSGDYVIFLPRNVETLFYLSLARSYSQQPSVQADLDSVIYPQLDCVEKMLRSNLKQFRDQDNHGIQLPPRWNEWYYPNNTYFLKPNEGQDIYLMLSQIYTHLKQPDKAKQYLAKSIGKQTTPSENCCELGPLAIEHSQIKALEKLTDPKQKFTSNEVWGLKFSALATLAEHDYSSVKSSLQSVQTSFTQTGSPFHYLGGNYDLAGMIALERLYATKTKDQSLKPLSDTLWNYLHGDNQFNLDFTNAPYVFHPCYFFHTCTLKNTLVNGIDSPSSTPDRTWNTSEVQLVGQARYVVTQILYLNL